MVAFKVLKVEINEQNISMKGEPKNKKNKKPEAYKFVNERKNKDIALSHAQAEEYIKYQEKYSGGLIGYRAYVSPITGMIYEEMLECHNDIPAQ